MDDVDDALEQPRRDEEEAGGGGDEDGHLHGGEGVREQAGMDERERESLLLSDNEDDPEQQRNEGKEKEERKKKKRKKKKKKKKKKGRDTGVSLTHQDIEDIMSNSDIISFSFSDISSSSESSSGSSGSDTDSDDASDDNASQATYRRSSRTLSTLFRKVTAEESGATLPPPPVPSKALSTAAMTDRVLMRGFISFGAVDGAGVESQLVDDGDSADPGVIKSGFMTRESKVLKAWATRWFVLRHQVLFYAKEQRPDTCLHPKGVIFLDGCAVHDASAYKHRKHCLAIDHPVRDPFYVCASSSREAREWRRAIEIAIDPERQHDSDENEPGEGQSDERELADTERAGERDDAHDDAGEDAKSDDNDNNNNNNNNNKGGGGALAELLRLTQADVMQMDTKLAFKQTQLLQGAVDVSRQDRARLLTKLAQLKEQRSALATELQSLQTTLSSKQIVSKQLVRDRDELESQERQSFSRLFRVAKSVDALATQLANTDPAKLQVTAAGTGMDQLELLDFSNERILEVEAQVKRKLGGRSMSIPDINGDATAATSAAAAAAGAAARSSFDQKDDGVGDDDDDDLDADPASTPVHKLRGLTKGFNAPPPLTHSTTISAIATDDDRVQDEERIQDEARAFSTAPVSIHPRPQRGHQRQRSEHAALANRQHHQQKKQQLSHSFKDRVLANAASSELVQPSPKRTLADRVVSRCRRLLLAEAALRRQVNTNFAVIYRLTQEKLRDFRFIPH
eukprot:TRINITY_DN66160_c2_g2_i2.p1 TRINITY_DN66160_c2_g2~~TRINITY_DN66160_c2_g2_i2.p1  ORF type:complete len:790 (-),score=400.99 TRINITY_DN66160_c2_g2_i2:126-2345(-)